MFGKKKALNSDDQNQKKAKPKRRSKKKIIIISAVVLALIGSGAAYIYHSKGASSNSSFLTAKVTRGDVSNVIEGSGTVEAIDQYEITSLVKGEVLADHFSEGQLVNKGDLLYEIDSTDMNNSIEKSKANLEKAQLSYEQTLESISKLSVASTISGVIKTLYIKDGDSISQGTKIADIINDEQMILNITFNKNDATNIFAGEACTVTLANSHADVSGTVRSVSTGSMVNSNGVEVTNVKITVNNPGSILSGEKATAIVGEYACNDAGTFEYSGEVTVTAEASGDVAALYYKEGDKITRGAVITKLTSSNSSSTLRQSKLSVQDAQLSLDNLYDTLEDYTIEAPISGKVIQKTIKAGENLDNTNTNTVMAIIADMSTLIFEMSIDELDISSIAVGQEVSITADAVEGVTFSGYVDNVSIVGTSSNGVTSYPVKIVVNDGEAQGLIPGMNVSANIVIEEKNDVLRVPVSAVRRGNLVIVNEDSTAGGVGTKAQVPSEAGKAMPSGMPGEVPEGMSKDNANRGSKSSGTGSAKDSTGSDDKAAKFMEARKSELDIPKGYKAVQVTTGLSDDDFIEITGGLNEGDTVVLPDTTSSETANSQMGMGMGMGGGMPGGSMPGGGMTSGGMSGNRRSNSGGGMPRG